jgi:hypothetical protein
MSLLALAAAAAQAAAAPAPAPAPAPMQLAPFTVEVKVAFGPGPAVRDCAVTLHGTPDPHWVDNACRNLGNGAFLGLLGAPAGASGRMTVLLTMEAAGRSEGPAAAPEGQMTFRSEARFAVSPAGAIGRCTPGEAAGRGGVLNLCETGLPKGNAFAQAPAERAGRLTLSAYTLTAPTPDEAP